MPIQLKQWGWKGKEIKLLYQDGIYSKLEHVQMVQNPRNNSFRENFWIWNKNSICGKNVLYLGLAHSRQYFQKLAPALSLDISSCFHLFWHIAKSFWKTKTAHKSGPKWSAFSLFISTGIRWHDISTRKGRGQESGKGKNRRKKGDRVPLQKF